jgi:PHD/YefM family antitoxin component YafN of YafNO toxin-antitoxin module
LEIYTYSEARQNFASLLEKAKKDGKVLIRRRDGSLFALTPERTKQSPLDIPGVDASVSTNEIIRAVRESRSRKQVG